jgi:hypothetical protein
MVSNSISVYKKSLSRGRINTYNLICNSLRAINIWPGDGVVPPICRLLHNSTRIAPPDCAANAELIEFAQTSNEIIIKGVMININVKGNLLMNVLIS